MELMTRAVYYPIPTMAAEKNKAFRLASFCQKLKNEGRIMGYTEGVEETLEIIQKEVKMMHYYTFRASFLDFLTQLYDAKTPLFSPELIRSAAIYFHDFYKRQTIKELAKVVSKWEDFPQTEAAWLYFLQQIKANKTIVVSETEQLKFFIFQFEKRANEVGFKANEKHFREAVSKLYDTNYKVSDFNVVITHGIVDELLMGVKSKHIELFKATFIALNFDMAFMINLSKVSMRGFLHFFEYFMENEMPQIKGKCVKKDENFLKNSMEFYRKVDLFFALWLQYKYPVLAQKINNESFKKLGMNGKWIFRNAIKYAPVFLLKDWCNSNWEKWEFEFARHIVKGNSPRTFKLSETNYLSKKAAHFLMNSKANNFKNAFWEAKMQALDVPKPLWNVFGNHFKQFPHRMLEECVRFFMRQAILSNQEYMELFSYINHVVDETGVFSFKGKTLYSLKRAYDLWQVNRQLLYANSYRRKSWKGAAMKNMCLKIKVDDIIVEYTFIQLLTTYDLVYEGQIMHHCVGNYAGLCASNKCSIWALRKTYKGQVEHLATVQVSTNRVITQIRSKYNALVSDNYLAMIKKWANTEGVRFP
jgi:PcfJ-like protein